MFALVSRAESCCFQCEVPVGVHVKELHWMGQVVRCQLGFMNVFISMLLRWSILVWAQCWTVDPLLAGSLPAFQSIAYMKAMIFEKPWYFPFLDFLPVFHLPIQTLACITSTSVMFLFQKWLNRPVTINLLSICSVLRIYGREYDVRSSVADNCLCTPILSLPHWATWSTHRFKIYKPIYNTCAPGEWAVD